MMPSERERAQIESRNAGTLGSYAALYQDFQKKWQLAEEANKAREAEIRNTYAGIISGYEQGGAARTLGEAQIEQGKTQAIGAGTQQMISSGLYGTTTAAAIPMRAEADASMNRLKLEDMLLERTNQAKMGLSGFVERIDNPYPDPSMLQQAMIAQMSMPNQQPYSGGGYGGGYGGTYRPTDSFDYWSSQAGTSGSTAKEQSRYSPSSGYASSSTGVPLGSSGYMPMTKPTYEPQKMYPTRYK